MQGYRGTLETTKFSALMERLVVRSKKTPLPYELRDIVLSLNSIAGVFKDSHTAFEPALFLRQDPGIKERIRTLNGIKIWIACGGKSDAQAWYKKLPALGKLSDSDAYLYQITLAETLEALELPEAKQANQELLRSLFGHYRAQDAMEQLAVPAFKH